MPKHFEGWGPCPAPRQGHGRATLGSSSRTSACAPSNGGRYRRSEARKCTEPHVEPVVPEPTAPTASHAGATTCATVPNSLTFEATLPLEAATAATHADGSPHRRITAGEFLVNHRLDHPWAHRRLRCQQNRQSNRRRRHLGRSSRNRWSSCRGLALPHLRNERRKRTQCL